MFGKPVPSDILQPSIAAASKVLLALGVPPGLDLTVMQVIQHLTRFLDKQLYFDHYASFMQKPEAAMLPEFGQAFLSMLSSLIVQIPAGPYARADFTDQRLSPQCKRLACNR